MNFVMNGRTWKIVELSQDKIREEYKKYKYDGEPEQGKYFGLTYFDSQTIYVDADLHIQQKKQTLRHELMHCYLGCYGWGSSHDHFSEEDLCNIFSSAYDIIQSVISQYFSNEENR